MVPVYLWIIVAVLVVALGYGIYHENYAKSLPKDTYVIFSQLQWRNLLRITNYTIGNNQYKIAINTDLKIVPATSYEADKILIFDTTQEIAYIENISNLSINMFIPKLVIDDELWKGFIRKVKTHPKPSDEKFRSMVVKIIESLEPYRKPVTF